MAEPRVNLLEDEKKTSLTSKDFFDKIINVRLSARNVSTGKIDTFIIRSDFEAVDIKNSIGNILDGNTSVSNKYEIRKVSHKPSIKVQYKQVAKEVAIAIDVFISNFFVNTSDGQFLMSFNNSSYPLEQIDIQMGYFPQFQERLQANPNLPNWGLTKEKLEEDFDREDNCGIQTITINVDEVTTDKLPPDSVLHIYGYVGSTTEIAVDTSSNPFEEEENEKYFEDMKAQAEEIYADTSKSLMENLFFYYITRRYKRTKIERGKFEVKAVTDKNKVFTKSFAEKNGVKVHLSKFLKEWEDGKETSAGSGIAVKKYTNISFGGNDNTLVSAIQKIGEHIGVPLASMRLNDGNIYVYEADRYTYIEENADLEKEYKNYMRKKMLEDTKGFNQDTQNNSYWKGKIPAVYNINFDATAIIVCPFFTFLNPFENVEFASRYPLSNMVTYWGGFKPTIFKFLVTQISVSFATVEQVNEMQINSVSWTNVNEDEKASAPLFNR